MTDDIEQEVTELLQGWTAKVREVMDLDPDRAFEELDDQPREHLVWFAFAALWMLDILQHKYKIAIEQPELVKRFSGVDDEVRRRALGR